MKTKGFKVLIIIFLSVTFIVAGLFFAYLLLLKNTVPVISNNHSLASNHRIDYPLNSYDYDNISIDGDGFRYYTENGEIISTMGVDVSYFQGDIDWKKVRASGIDFAIIRVGYRGRESGLLNLDDTYHKNMQGASEAGIKLGVYFFSQAINVKEAEEEAKYVIEQIKDYELDYPVIFDWEGAETDNARTLNIDGETITNLCISFSDAIIKAGYKPMIYSNREFTSKLLDLEALADYHFWYAEYRDRPSLKHNFTIWQYTHEGTVDGISFPVDLNISFFPYSKSIHSNSDESSQNSEIIAETEDFSVN